MDLKFDADEFDKYQIALIDEIATAVKVKLQEGGLEGAALEDMTGGITSSIANIIDDMAAIEADGTEIRPFLMFRMEDESLLHCGENACTNNFVYNSLKKLFG